jgi:hypothetical protein
MSDDRLEEALSYHDEGRICGEFETHGQCSWVPTIIAALRERDKRIEDLQPFANQSTMMLARVKELEAALSGRTVSCVCGGESEKLRAELTAAREAIGVAREALEDSLDILDDMGDVVLEVMSVERVDGTYQRIRSALSKLSELSKKEDGKDEPCGYCDQCVNGHQACYGAHPKEDGK